MQPGEHPIPHEASAPSSADPSRRRRGSPARAVAVTLSVLAHAALLPALLLARADAPDLAVADPVPPVFVTLIEPPLPPPPPPPPPGPAADPAPAPGPPTATPPKPAPPAAVVPPIRPRPPRRPPPPEVPTLPAPPPRPAPIQTARIEPWTTVGEAQLAGALTAGSGGGGGSGAGGAGPGGAGGQGPGDCDLVRSLQSKLRADPEVRAAAARAQAAAGPGRALLVWNGDWVRVPGQSGKGLAGVRQAIALEVAFAPEACRARPMRGLVLITFADAPGAPRLALGTGAWRWTDLLGAG